MTKPFRFGIQLHAPSPGQSWGETARQIEDLGWSTLVMPDHLNDQLAVGPALAAAGEATTSLRLGALVFGNDYRHPIMLAKEMATLDVLSGGRMEFGLGAGWMKTDYDQMGMEYESPGTRIDRMLESLAIVRGLFGDGPVDFEGQHYTITAANGFPKPIQSPPPFLIGGGGQRMCKLAGREADIVGVTANLRAGAIGPDAAADVTSDRFDQKLEWVREGAGDRFDDIELNVLAMSTQITGDRTAALLEGTAAMFGMAPEQVAQSPIVLIGSTDEIAEDLRIRRERWGFNYIIVQGNQMIEAMAPVIDQLAGT